MPSTERMRALEVYRGYVVAPPDDSRLLRLIPGARRLNSKAILVPHDEDSTRLLRNLSYEVPSPIITGYDWCGMPAFESQKITSAHIVMNRRCFVLSEPGVGKTLSALFAFDFLRKRGLAAPLLVVAPLSTLRFTWQREISLRLPHLKAIVVYGAAAKRRKLLEECADVYIINFDGVNVLTKELMQKGFGMAVIDELTAYKNARSQRWKAAAAVLQNIPRVVGMTGTPTPQGPMDAFGQVKLIDKSRMTVSATAFRQMTMVRYGPFTWLPRAGANAIVKRFMAPSVRFTRDECFDLPPITYIEREAPLTPAQAAAYKAMTDKLCIACAGGAITAVNEADKLNLLLQISLGAVYNDQGSVTRLDVAPRLAVLDEIVEEAPAKVIVFTPYKSSLATVAEHLAKRWSVITISGDTSAAKRATAFGDFQNKVDPHIIVAHPATVSHGLTLTAAATVIWFGPATSLEQFEQANARITRTGQKHKQLIVQICGTKVETKIFTRLRNRAKLQGLLLEMYQKQQLREVI